VTRAPSGFAQQVPQRNSELKIDELQSVARKIRARTTSNSHLTQTPHLGSCLSCVDILVAAYFHGLRIDPRNPTD
jgi:transketolase